MLNIRTNAAILNIFRNDAKHIESFIHEHAPFVRQVLLLDTGSTDGSYELALKAADGYHNVKVCRFSTPTINFSTFRNRCLEYFDEHRLPAITHYFWVDTDERLQVHQSALPLADIYELERHDASGRYSTWLQRGFSVEASKTGKWAGIVHEGFYIPEEPPLLRISQLSLLHLESETKRSQEKKLLYFDLVNEQLRQHEAEKNYLAARQYASLALLMASFDFEEPLLCAQLFKLHRDLFDDLSNVTITEINALIHVVRSLSRLGEDAISLGERVMQLHPAKTTAYQVLRALLLNYHNTPLVKRLYETWYPELPDCLVPEFYNADFSLPEQVMLFERRLVRQQHWLDSGYLRHQA